MATLAQKMHPSGYTVKTFVWSPLPVGILWVAKGCSQTKQVFSLHVAHDVNGAQAK